MSLTTLTAAARALKERQKNRNLPSVEIPRVQEDELARTLQGIQEHLRMYEGDSGAPKERFVTIAELENAGLIKSDVKGRFAFISQTLGKDVAQKAGSTLNPTQTDPIKNDTSRKPRTPEGGGGAQTTTSTSTAAKLNDAQDVNVSKPVKNEFLYYDGNKFTNYALFKQNNRWLGTQRFDKAITLQELADGPDALDGLGYLWVKDDTPNTLWFTNDAGTDTQLGTGGGSQTPWTADIDGAGFGLDNIDRLEIQASGVATDTATFTHDGTDFNTVFANTTDWNISGITAIQAGAVDADFDAITATSYGGIAEANLVDKTATESISGVWTHTARLDIDGASNANFLEFRNTSTADLLRVFMSSTLWELRPNGTATLGFGHSFSTSAWFCDTDFSAETVTATDLQVTLASGQALIQSTSLGTGETTSLQLEDQSGNLLDAGFNVMRRATSANTSFTLGAEECGQYWDKTGSTPYTVTLAASTDLDFPVYGVVTLMNKFTSGDITVTEGSGTTLYYMDPAAGRVDTAGGCTIQPGGVATIQRAASTSYYIWGSAITA